jgi:hypothetical protein
MNRFYLKTLGDFRISKESNEILNLALKPVRCAVFQYISFNRSIIRD